MERSVARESNRFGDDAIADHREDAVEEKTDPVLSSGIQELSVTLHPKDIIRVIMKDAEDLYLLLVIPDFPSFLFLLRLGGTR